MNRIQPLKRIPVGVVIERRKATSPWVDFLWRPIAVLPGIPDAKPWTALEVDTERTQFYGGSAEIELYRSDTSGYRDNLAPGAASLWVVVRPTGVEPPYEIAAVTADPSEGEAYNEGTANLVETVSMPQAIRAALAEFVAEHHVEHPFVKRERDRADPEAMTWHDSLKDRK